MTKQIRYIIITVCVIAVLGVVLVLIKFLPTGKKSSSSSALVSSSSISLINYKTDNVVTIHIVNSTGQYTIRKTSDSWTVDELSTYPLNQSNITNIVDEMIAVSASQTVTPSSSGLGQFGLATPKATADLATNDGKVSTLLVGNETPTSSGYYAMIKGDSKIYIIDTSIGGDLLASSQNLLDLQLSSLDATKVTSLTKIVMGGTQRPTPVTLQIDATTAASYSATEDQNGNLQVPAYNISSPGFYDGANPDNLNTMVNGLISLDASDIVSLDTTDKSLNSYGLKNPAYTFTYTYDKKDYTLSFGNTFTKDGEEYVYVTMTGKKIIYDIATSSAAFYKWQLLDVCPSLIYSSPNIDTIKTITVKVGSNTWTYNLSGTGDSLKITSNSKTLDTTQFRTLYQQLIYMVPTGTAEKSSSSKVLATITFLSRDANKKTDLIEFLSLPDASNPSQDDAYKTLCSVNGNANFYINKSKIDDLSKYSQDIIDGKTIPGI